MRLSGFLSFSLASLGCFFNFFFLKLWNKNHKISLLNNGLFEATFSDSGFWDYAVLSAFDTFFRVVIVFTINPISEFLIIEKASFLISSIEKNLKHINLVNSNFFGFFGVLKTLTISSLVIVLILGFYMLGCFF